MSRFKIKQYTNIQDLTGHSWVRVINIQYGGHSEIAITKTIKISNSDDRADFDYILGAGYV